MPTVRMVLKEIPRIEGHLNLTIHVYEDGGIKVRAEAAEGVRILENILRGMDATDVPDITSRMCGVCHAIHKLTSLKAVENALNIELPEGLSDLRELLAIVGLLQSHVLHLFLFTLPDVLGKDSILELVKADAGTVRNILYLKKLTNTLVRNLSGRSVHMITPCIGGFTKIPSKNDFERASRILNDFKETVKQSLERILSAEYPDLHVAVENLALKDRNLPLLEGNIGDLQGEVHPPEKYASLIKPIAEDYSTARHYVLKKNGGPYMVGALARLNVNKDNLPSEVKSLLRDLGLKLPSLNPFHNNLAQAVELMYFAEKGIRLAEKLAEKPPKTARISFKRKKGSGVAVTEAPRGTLIHHYVLDEDGRVTEANIVTPTAQNYKAIEKAVEKYVSLLLDKGVDNPLQLKNLVEKLVRSFDPCVSCSSRFLKQGKYVS